MALFQRPRVSSYKPLEIHTGTLKIKQLMNRHYVVLSLILTRGHFPDDVSLSTPP